MKLAYEAFDKSGKLVSAMIDANDAAEATETLRRQGMYVRKVSGEASPEAEAGGKRKMPSKGRRLKNMAMFSRQLFVLVQSGTPMVQALSAIERQTEDKNWRHVLVTLRERVEEGVSLSSAMEEQPEHFNPVCRSLMAAGESSGKLAPMLDRLSSLSRKELHQRSAILGAMVYPCLLICVGACVLVGMLVFVLPRFKGLFQTLDVPLPPTTVALVFVSDSLQAYWWLAILLLFGAFFGLKYWLGTPAGKRQIDSAFLKLPKIGKLTRSLSTAEFARLLGVLLEGQVPLLDALKLTKQGARNSHYAELITTVEDAVARGEPMSNLLTRSDLITPAVSEAVRNGEQSGQVGLLLVNMADFLDEENETIVKSVTSIIEPLILVGLGIIVGFIALSMFLPLFDLAGMTQGGG